MHALLAQAVQANPQEVELIKAITAWAQLGAIGVVSGLLIFILVKHLPKKDSDHAAELRDVRNWHTNEAKEQRDCFEKCVDEFNRTTVMLWEKLAGK